MKNYLLITLFSILCVGCDECNKIDRANNTIDKAIATMATQTSGLENTINQIAKDIPHEIHDIIGNDLEILAKDVVGATAADTRCTIDFIRMRAIQALKNFKLRLLKKPLMPLQPGFCTLNISSIDLNSDPISRGTLNIYGFDLNTPDTSKRLIQAALIGRTDKKLIDEEYMGRTTNYHLSINLNSLIPDLVENKYRKIQLYWNGDTINMPQILIQDWKAKVKTVEFTPTPFTFVPPHTGGDADFNTGGDRPAEGDIKVEFNVTKTYVEAKVYMDVMEERPDNTRVGKSIDPRTNSITDATAWSQWTRIYTVTDNNYEIQDFSPNTSSLHHLKINSKGQKQFFMGGGSVSSYTVDLDHEGDEAGTYTKVEVWWNKLAAILVEKKPTK